MVSVNERQIAVAHQIQKREYFFPTERLFVCMTYHLAGFA